MPSRLRRHGLALAVAAIAPGLAAPASAAQPAREHLQVHGRTILAREVTALSVTAGPGLRLTGPHTFIKTEDNGYRFEVSLASMVSPDAVISVAAERLIEAGALNYDDLAAARWPDAGFRVRASGCAVLTPAQAAAMPPQSGMGWILAAGFRPQGAFAFEAAILVAPDRRHEATIELIAPVKSCADPKAITTALDALRARIKVVRAAPRRAT